MYLMVTDTKTKQPQKMRGEVNEEKFPSDESKLKQEASNEGQQGKQQPPSATSSPSHEFSFTISLHQAAAAAAASVPENKAKTLPSFAVDLSPADEIFFHGHLLPLHLLSHLPVSARSSTNSLDNFTLPIREQLEDQNQTKNNSDNDDDHNNNTSTNDSHKGNYHEIKARTKSKSFSLFGRSKWRKGCEVREKEDDNEERDKRKKLRFDVTQLLKRYMRMVRPLLSFRGRRGNNNMQFHRQSYSLSGILSSRGSNKQELRGRRREFSAPASIRTSPTNSGLLVATGAISTATSDSTMEELQAAIQAAIAHCKNSIAMDEKIKSHDN